MQKSWASNRMENCAPFCAHPRSKTVTTCGTRTGEGITHTVAQNQHHNEGSHSVVKPSAATVNRRVASSNLARGANLLLDSQTFMLTSVSRELGTFGTASTASGFGNSKARPMRSATSARNFVSFPILMYLSVTVCRTASPSLDAHSPSSTL
jgi:hypothetical protein